MDGSPINVGELRANNIADFATGNKKDVPYLSLINWLCEEAECDLYVNDLDAPMMKPINDKNMETFMKDYVERLQQLGDEEAAEVQAQPQELPPHEQFVQGGGEQLAWCLCTYSSHDAGLHVQPFQLDE